MEISRNFLFKIILIVVFLAIVFIFGGQIQDLIVKAQEEYLSSPAQEKEEVVEPRFKSLGITGYDSPETMIYKLFRNLDTSFLNINTTAIDSKLTYYPFILNLSTKQFDDTSGDLINMVREGIRNFTKYDNIYQIGTDAQQTPNPPNPNCGSVVRGTVINYNNDCWDSSLASPPNPLPDPCNITVHGDSGNKFDGEVKIRVVWYLGGTAGNGRQIIYPLITICDDES